MRSFLGVPILLRGVAYGNLYLTEKEGGEDFTDEDDELTQLLAAQAAVAIENARLYESVDPLAPPARVAARDRGRARLGARARAAPRAHRAAACASSSTRGSSLIALPDGGELPAVAAADGDADVRRSSACALEFAGSKAGRVLERGAASASTPCSTIPEIDQQAARRLGVRAALFVPLVARGGRSGS